MNRSIRHTMTCLGGLLLAMSVAAATSPHAAASTEQQQLVDKAKLTAQAFASDPEQQENIRHSVKDVKAVFICPQLLRGAFIFGGTGGAGVLLVRDGESGEWSQPAFYNVAAVSFGFQAGADTSELIILVRTQKGLEEFYRSDFKLGAEGGATFGPAGGSAAVEGITGDLLAYGRTKGMFAGMALNGAAIAVSDESNQAYYGKPVRPTDIVVKRTVNNPASADLRAAVVDLLTKGK
ncbi:MAG TPA: lipid-binding SYLF domain-containing protein [Nitrospira sp.]|nr:lipid-binding SYLF domain-containing protein [Nitrospira sp.]